jgi:hypothetical protein
MFVNVINFVQQKESHNTFVEAFNTIKSELERQLFTKQSVPYIQVETGWWMFENGNKLNWKQICDRANKENVI